MATCKDCFHYEACGGMFEVIGFVGNGIMDNADKLCDKFKDKSRFVELPCKVGDVVYIKIGDNETPYFVDPGEVFAIGIDENEIMWISARYESGLKYYHTADDIGKTVFLTREEAEAALRKEKENAHDRRR